MIQGVQHVEFGNAEAAETAIKNLIAVGETVAAMIVEPIQVAAGVVAPPEGYLQQIRRICDRYGVLLILDEIELIKESFHAQITLSSIRKDYYDHFFRVLW